MTSETLSKAQWLERMDREQAAWEAIVAEANAKGLDVPGAAGDWTFNDVLGHLNGWRIRTVDRLEAGARGTEPAPVPWPSEFVDETDEGVEAINGWFYERYRDWSAEQVLAESRDQFRRMRAAVEAILNRI